MCVNVVIIFVCSCIIEVGFFIQCTLFVCSMCIIIIHCGHCSSEFIIKLTLMFIGAIDPECTGIITHAHGYILMAEVPRWLAANAY